jgi:hypothetical protein
MIPKEASRRLPNGAVELTGAKDADGILVELTWRDVERMGTEAVAGYKERREKLIAARKAEGGTRRDAEAACRAHSNEQGGCGSHVTTSSSLYRACLLLTALDGSGTGGTGDT